MRARTGFLMLPSVIVSIADICKFSLQSAVPNAEFNQNFHIIFLSYDYTLILNPLIYCRVPSHRYSCGGDCCFVVEWMHCLVSVAEKQKFHFRYSRY